jgi:hypothetical protein
MKWMDSRVKRPRAFVFLVHSYSDENRPIHIVLVIQLGNFIEGKKAYLRKVVSGYTSTDISYTLH